MEFTYESMIYNGTVISGIHIPAHIEDNFIRVFYQILRQKLVNSIPCKLYVTSVADTLNRKFSCVKWNGKIITVRGVYDENNFIGFYHQHFYWKLVDCKEILLENIVIIDKSHKFVEKVVDQLISQLLKK